MADPSDLFSMVTDVVVPPVRLVQKGELPDSAGILVKAMSSHVENLPALARKLVSLCRITGMLWVVWLWNICFALVIGVLCLMSWADWVDLTHTACFSFSYKQVIAILSACLCFGAMVRFVFATISLTLAQACDGHMKTKKR